MENFIFYLGKMILCSGVMFAYYLLFLKDKTFHHYNRFYLLLTVIISLLLPLVKVSYFTIETNRDFYLLLSKLNQNQLQNSTNDLIIYQIFYAVIGVVSIALLTRLVLGILRIQRIKNQFPNESIEGIKFYQTDLNNAPFSFFRNLFWKKSIEIDSPVGQQILKHEMVHIEQKHSWDKLLMQTVKSVFWFNPVFYFINKEINLIHEYLADSKAVKKSDTKAFAQMLLESHFSGSVIPATSPFLSSNLKKRLKMLTKNKTKYSYARKLFALPILFFMVFAYMVNAKNKEITETNKAIEIAVKELKNDTIKPKTSELDSLSKNHQTNTRIYTDALQEDHLKMSAISKKMAEKSKELSALKRAKKEESSEYKALENEMETLASQLEGVVNSENYKRNLKGLELKSEALAKIYDSPAFKKRIAAAETSAKEAEKRINSPEFKRKIADAEKRALQAEKLVNSPEFKKRIADAEEQILETKNRISNSPELQRKIQDALKKAHEELEKFGKVYSNDEFQKIIKDQLGKDAFTDGSVAYGLDPSNFPKFEDLPKFNYNFSDDFFSTSDVSKLTPKELKKLEKKRKELRKKQQELLEEQKKLQEKQRELNKEYRQNNPWVLSVDARAKPTSDHISYVGVATYTEDSPKVNYYLNGTKISSKDFQNLNPNEIKKVDVLKGEKVGTIRIETR